MTFTRTRVWALLTALVMALGFVAMGAGSIPTARAELGAGGGGASGNWNNMEDFRGVLHYMFDAPNYYDYPQGTGLESFEAIRQAASAYYGRRVPTNASDDNWVRGICQTALREAEEATEGDEPARVIGLFWASSVLNPGGSSLTHSGFRVDWEDAYDSVNWAAAVDYSNYENKLVTENKVKYTVNELLFREVDRLIAQHNPPSFVCIATVEPSKKEIPPPKYDLNITTDSSVTGELPYGSTRGVSDLIHASTSGAEPDPTVEARVVLNYDTASNGLVSVAKNVSIATQGDTRSPEFTPADFGLTEWMPARYWFDVGVAEQGKMSGPVDTPDRDPRETFTVPPCGADCLTKMLTIPNGVDPIDIGSHVLAAGQSYNARIEASTDGHTTSMFIRDTVFTDQVNIGAATRDDVSTVKLFGPDGAEHLVSVSIDRSQAGKVLVTGTFTPTKQGIYALVVPTFALPNLIEYVIVDEPSWCGGNNLSVCYEGDAKDATKKTPDPDKAWVLDEASGELVEDRPQPLLFRTDDRFAGGAAPCLSKQVVSGVQSAPTPGRPR